VSEIILKNSYISLGDVTEAASDWLGLRDSFSYWTTAEFGYQATSQPLRISRFS
jgi:hypothetical protein